MVGNIVLFSKISIGVSTIRAQDWILIHNRLKLFNNGSIIMFAKYIICSCSTAIFNDKYRYFIFIGAFIALFPTFSWLALADGLITFKWLEKNVSSASMMPLTSVGLAAVGAVKNRCLQRKAVVLATSISSAIFVILNPYCIPSRFWIHLFRWRNRANGVPVKGLKVEPHSDSLHLKRCKPDDLPHRWMAVLPQWGQQVTSPLISSIIVSVWLRFNSDFTASSNSRFWVQ